MKRHRASSRKQTSAAPPYTPALVQPEALWQAALTVLLATGLAFGLYATTAAPGLTWAHFGADGGDLLAAAMTGGVPHPSGYPLYMALLQGWLRLGQWLAPQADPARLGNLFSALCAALTAGVTAAVVLHLLRTSLSHARAARHAIALGTALLWAVSPLQWSQALITEVYALHMLLAALLAWTLLAQPQRLLPAALVMALGLANHLTFALLLPAAAYWLWRQAARPRRIQPVALAVLCGASALTLLYATIPRAAGGGESLPPVNWGYPDQWSGLWWLVSGAAYRRYMAAMTVPEAMTRLTGWARLFVQQYTVVGLLAAGWGLAAWDRRRPELRNFSLLWALPISVYALVYATYDSQVYLLPATWMLALWLASGLAAASLWLPGKLKTASAWPRYAPAALALAAALTLTAARLPFLSLRHDDEARAYLAAAIAVIEPDSIVVSGADAETFALWYGAWGSGELLAHAPGTVLVNYALYQFAWYARLLGDLYPTTPGVANGLTQLLAGNDGVRPIYFTEQLDTIAPARLQPVGPLWRYTP